MSDRKENSEEELETEVEFNTVLRTQQEGDERFDFNKNVFFINFIKYKGGPCQLSKCVNAIKTEMQ